MTSPLGKYAQIVAAIVAIGVIAAYVVLIVFGTVAGVETTAGERSLRDLALIALGAVFGSFAAVNGVKAPIDAAHNRIDRLEVATNVPTHGSYVDPVARPPDPVDRSARKSP